MEFVPSCLWYWAQISQMKTKKSFIFPTNFKTIFLNIVLPTAFTPLALLKKRKKKLGFNSLWGKREVKQ